jgi:hypothetical protein
MVQKFLLQLRQQPLLTFVSIGMADGEFYGGNRPPRGDDRGLRILHARIADERRLHVYRVDETGLAADLLSGATSLRCASAAVVCRDDRPPRHCLVSRLSLSDS